MDILNRGTGRDPAVSVDVDVEDVEGTCRDVHRLCEGNRDDVVRCLCECTLFVLGQGLRGLVPEYVAVIRKAGGSPHVTARALLRIGAALERAGLPQCAVDCYGSAVNLCREDTLDAYFIYNNLGYCLAVSGRFAEAVPHCLAAIRVDPARHNAFKNLGLAFEGLGRTEDAAGCFRHACWVNPDDHRSRRHLAALLHSGRVEDVPDLAARRRCRDRAMGCMRQLEREGGARFDGRWLALADFDAMYLVLAQRLDADRGSLCLALGMLAWTLAARDVPLDAPRVARHIVASGTPAEAAHALVGLAHNLSSLKNDSEALGFFDRAAALLPAADDFLRMEYHFCLGDRLIDLCRHAQAERHFRECLRLDPWLDLGHRGLGIVLLGLGRPAEAEREIRVADSLTRARPYRVTGISWPGVRDP